MRKIQDQLIKYFLIQKETEEKNQQIDEYAISKKLDLVDLVKNLPTETGDRRRKPNTKFNKNFSNPNRR